MTVERFARHAQLDGCEGVLPAAVGLIDDAGLVRLAAILRRRGWRPSTAEQARIDAARSVRHRPPVREGHATSGWSLPGAHGRRALSLAGDDRGLDIAPGGNGATRPSCERCGRQFSAKRSGARYGGSTCRRWAHRHGEVVE
ncbi:MAG: hypothetical protein M3R46_13900 [Actinomycetota bacterium]|jgi:hypothetical protein|nr:hypothetical protein [Actinomycetota bacterium]